MRMDSTATDFDILIVGGGMAGAALACALGAADTGWRIGLVEQAPPQDTDMGPVDDSLLGFELRVSALSLASQYFLDRLGVWRDIQARRASPYTGMYVWDAEGTGHIEFQAADLYEPALGHIVENRVTQTALWRRLRQLPVEPLADRVLAWQPLERGSQVILGDGRTLRARLVVAADGADSPLRRMAGIGTREWDYQQMAIVATVATEQSHQRIAWQRFLDTGPLAFLPLRGRDGAQFSSIVWSTTPEAAQRLLALDDAAFRQELGLAFEHRLGSVTGVSRRAAFPLRQRHAKTYVRPGLALVADAAHTIHPLAGQGINLGLLDVAVLADELLRARERELAIDDLAVLGRYQRRRMGHNLGMMAVMEGFKQLFGADALPLRWMRNTGMRLLNGHGLLKNRIVAQAMGRDLLPARWQPEVRSWNAPSDWSAEHP